MEIKEDSTFAAVDESMPIEIYGYCHSDSFGDSEGDALWAKLKEQIDYPIFNADLVDGAEILINPLETPRLIDLLRKSPFREELEGMLQCISETKEGRPLLTTFFDIESFTEFVEEVKSAFPLLEGVPEAWKKMGVVEVDFSFYTKTKAHA